MVFRSSRSRTSVHLESPLILPPKLSEIALRPFTSIERAALVRMLGEPAWPRGTLNICGLDGYLTALLVWPGALQPGAWLPPIWNEGGWKVHPPIDTLDLHREFLELVVGLLCTIDRGLLQTPPLFDHGLHVTAARELPEAKTRAQSWAEGFGRALRQSVQSRGAPSQATREAVRHIATFAASESWLTCDSAQRASTLLTDAVLLLASTRASRGPFGALPKPTVTPQVVYSRPPQRGAVVPGSDT